MYAIALQTASVCSTNLTSSMCNVLQKRRTKKYNLAITVDKNYEKLVQCTFSSNTLPTIYYMNVEFNEKFDKRNCMGHGHVMSSLSCFIK